MPELLAGMLLSSALVLLGVRLPFYREVAALGWPDIIYFAARGIVGEENACAVGIFIEGKVSAVGGEYCHFINEFTYFHPNANSDLPSFLLRNPHIAVPSAAVAAAEALERRGVIHCLLPARRQRSSVWRFSYVINFPSGKFIRTCR